MRHIEFLDAEIAEVERLIAREALRSADARRLMTVPGVNVICAASFMAAIGDIRRFRTSRQLVAYLGLDPKVRQSGSEPARGGSPSAGRRRRAGRWSRRRGRRRSARTAAGFYDGSAPAAATARPSLLWRASSRPCSGVCFPAARTTPTQPSLTTKKMRLLEMHAGAPALKGKRTGMPGLWATRERMRHAERELAQQAEASYTPEWSATGKQPGHRRPRQPSRARWARA